LFSKTDVAEYVNKNFEPAWESVRPVPIVKIDFGGGNVLTRTLHGNIATYLCAADGTVLDLVPGIYTPDVYKQRLMGFVRLAYGARGKSGDRLTGVVKAYHDNQIAEIDRQAAPAAKARDGGKRAIEFPTKAAIAAAVPAPAERAKFDTPEDLANWDALVEDTRANETVRKRQVHELLARSGRVRPGDVKKVVYKDILHADLDDPYLGLGPSLFASYPFAKEDGARPPAAPRSSTP
jgi:hypothetical protein